MKLPTLLLIVLLLAVAALTALNWNAFNAPTDLSLGVATVQLPLGLVMLSVLVLLTVCFLGFVTYMMGSALMETRRYGKELQANRTLADQAEASRFTELRTFLVEDFARQVAANAATEATLLARIERLERELRDSVEQSGNTLAAYIGELEDRLDKTLPAVRREMP